MTLSIFFCIFQGCPLRCRVAEYCRVSVDLRQLELIPINKPARFDVDVEGGKEADLDVTVTGSKC